MFETEQATFEKHRKRLWKKYPFRYIAVLGKEIIGPYIDIAVAYQNAAELFGVRSGFMLKEIREKEPSYWLRPNGGLTEIPSGEIPYTQVLNE